MAVLPSVTPGPGRSGATLLRLSYVSYRQAGKRQVQLFLMLTGFTYFERCARFLRSRSSLTNIYTRTTYHD